jgi:iron complex outermembrane receptor protein
MIAQDMAPDTVLNLEDVTIYSDRISRFAKGQAMQTLDSLSRAAYPAATLAELISGSTSAYIRNYGQGTLSTLSFRGTSANHAALLWNGILLAPPNIGYVDLSLVQGNYFNEISILYGGASPMFGSGSIGGGIHLENRPIFEKSGFDAGLNLSAGSFGMVAVEANGTVYRKNFYSRTAFNLINSTNDFPYNNLYGEKDTLPHASIFKSGFIQDIAYQLPGNQYLMASTWFQYADRDIPPTLTEDTSEANQLDRSWRMMILWKDYNSRNNLEAKLAYFNEFTRYDDPPASVYSTIKSQSLVGSFESTWEIGKNSSVFAGTQFTYEYADLDYYDHARDQENLAIFASFRHNFPSLQWQASLNGRQEFLTDYRSPFLFSAGFEGRIWRFISGRFNISRNFRAPTFNERYWQPGGNPDLESEKSWNEEASISIENQFSASVIKFRFTAYNSNVNNWILWSQLPGDSFWSVENAQEVWSRGFEISGNQSVSPGRILIFLAESYSYTKSTNEKKLFELDASYKKQLVNTPVHRFIMKTGGIYKGFNITLKGNFTGEIFTTKDNTDDLPPYLLLDAVISKSFKVKKGYPLTIQINLNNLLNKDYQAVPYRPMPGFNFLVTIKLAVGSRQ